MDTRQQAKPDKKPSFLTRLINQWWTRLLNAIYSGGFSNQTEEYASHRTKRDYLWNSIGWGVWGGMFPLLTIVATQLSGVEKAGMFSMAFVVANLLLFIGNYGVRTYQVSDIDEEHSFNDYVINRVLTCLAMLVIGFLYCKVRGYAQEMTDICAGVFAFRAIDAFADVFEGRLQQKDKLYLAGISMTLRSAVATVIFSIILFLTRNIAVAGYAMAIAAAVSLVLLTIPLALLETPRSRKASIREIRLILINCFPLFIAVFLYSLIDTMPKFAMEGILSYKNQLYFNAMYFPAHSIIMMTGIVYKPQLVRLSNIWNTPEKRSKFNLIIWAMLGLVLLISGVVGIFMAWIGIPIMSFMYGIDFNQFRILTLIMVACGGTSAAIDFLYQIITILRQQKEVTRIYLVVFALSIPLSYLLVHFAGLGGAVVDNLAIMVVLLVMLVGEYIRIKKRLSTKAI